MDASDLCEAHRFAQLLTDDGRAEARRLAPRLRSTGLMATLAWLRESGRDRDKRKNRGKIELDELMQARFGVNLDRIDSRERMARYREALRFAEALYVLLRQKETR
ncbi:MAG TPA: hypothetical protein ENK18_09845 [Deltaproteobacteria bacterium]|nr:hypothetical protein [Deltaproteobacteria bacterium]